MSLRDSKLKDREAREMFYRKVIESLELEESGYLILLVHDDYDVPRRAKDDTVMQDASDEVFSYILCCICPIKERKAELGFSPATTSSIPAHLDRPIAHGILYRMPRLMTSHPHGSHS